MDPHPVFLTPQIPETVVERFDFLYSDDPADNSAYTLAELAGIMDNGRAREYFQPGDRIKMVIPKNEIFNDGTIVLMVLGFNHYRLADGSGDFGGVVFGMIGVMNSQVRMHSVSNNAGGWPVTELRAKLNGDYYAALPLHWQKLIRKVQVRCTVGQDLPDIDICEDRLLLLSDAEINWYPDAVPNKDEVDPQAETVTFPVFTDITSRIRCKYNGTGAGTEYWCRTTVGSDRFRKIAGHGGTEEMSAVYAAGICWACSMGVKGT